MSTPQIGYQGQRYEVWCDDTNGEPFLLGWTNNPEAYRDMTVVEAVGRHTEEHEND